MSPGTAKAGGGCWNRPARLRVRSREAAELPTGRTDHGEPPRAANAAAWELPPRKSRVREGSGGSAHPDPTENQSWEFLVTFPNHPGHFARPNAAGKTRATRSHHRSSGVLHPHPAGLSPHGPRGANPLNISFRLRPRAGGKHTGGNSHGFQSFRGEKKLNISPLLFQHLPAFAQSGAAPSPSDRVPASAGGASPGVTPLPRALPEAAAGVRIPPGRTQNGETGSWQEASAGLSPKPAFRSIPRQNGARGFPACPRSPPPRGSPPAASAASQGRFCPGRSDEEKEAGLICVEEDIFLKKKQPKTED